MTTTHLLAAGRRHLRPLADVHVRRALAIVALPLVLAVVGALASARPAAPVVPLPTAPPIILVATPTMTDLAVAAAPPRTGLPRAVVAYDAPGGSALGAIEAGRAFTPTVRSGLEWLQIDAADSGLVWVRVAELVDGLASLPDVATPVPPAAPIIVEAAPEPADQAILVEQPRPTVDHAACCEKAAPDRADRRRAFNALRGTEVAP